MKTDHIISLISKVRDRANKYIIEELKARNIEGLVPSHGRILSALYQNNKLCMNEVAKIINKDKSTVTALVNKLSDLEIIKKIYSSTDKRITLIELTKKGEVLKPDFQNISVKLLFKVYKGMSNEDKENIVTLLTKILNNFE